MAQAWVRERGAPWTFRLFEAIPLPPVCVGLAAAVLLLAGFAGAQYATGGVIGEGARPASSFLALSTTLLILAYLPTAQVYLARWTGRHLAQLRPLLRDPDAPPAVEASVSPWLNRAVGAVGASSFAVLFLILPGDIRTDPRASHWALENAMPWAVVPLLGWLLARFANAVVAEAIRFSRLARELRQIELLDPAPLRPFVQQGLRSALLVILLVSLGSGGLVDLRVAMLGAAANVAAFLAIAVVALVLPVGGLRRRIRAEKGTQLAALRAQLDAERRRVLAGGAEVERAAARLPGMLALEARLEAVREWPFDLPSLLRFALYLGLGVGSWLGAAAVERLLDALLE